MQNILLAFVISAATLVGGITASQAQQGPSGPMMQPGSQSDDDGLRMAGPGDRHGMIDRKAWGRRDRGPGMAGPGMLLMMMIMVDTNGDRMLSLEEVQAVHARIFSYADGDGDGQLTLEEIQSFIHQGGPTSDR